MNLKEFLKQFGIAREFNETVLGRSYFTTKENSLSEYKPVYLGECIAHKRGETIIPSIDLLQWMGKTSKNKVVLTPEGEWLFICGRDIFSKSIVSHTNPKIGEITVILNKEEECIGYGNVINPLQTQGKRPVIKRLFDIGDLLRRERKNQKCRF